jgi:hypothetical protein
MGAASVTVKFTPTPKLATLPWVQIVFAPESTLAVQLGVVVSQFPETLVPTVAPSGSQESIWARADEGSAASARAAMNEGRFFILF